MATCLASSRTATFKFQILNTPPAQMSVHPPRTLGPRTRRCSKATTTCRLVVCFTSIEPLIVQAARQHCSVLVASARQMAQTRGDASSTAAAATWAHLVVRHREGGGRDRARAALAMKARFSCRCATMSRAWTLSRLAIRFFAVCWCPCRLRACRPHLCVGPQRLADLNGGLDKPAGRSALSEECGAHSRPHARSCRAAQVHEHRHPLGPHLTCTRKLSPL